MAIDFASVYLTGTGMFLPGEPVDNDAIDGFIAPLDARSARIKRRILADNGIRTRHYAIDREGRTIYSSAQMAAEAARDALAAAGVTLEQVSVLCTGSSGGDLAMPGFANMVQGELGAGPMHTSSHQGVCASGVAALQHAASMVQLGRHEHALVVASEMPSRMFKRSRFAPRDYHADFDSHFLRWMLSDGAGACLLGREPSAQGLSLRLDWLHLRSFSGDHPVCMQIGGGSPAHPSYLDYPSLAEAEQDGAFLLRQDIRLLPRLFELGIHEYVGLIRRERIDVRKVDHFLCHYSSAKFAPLIEDLMTKAGFLIPRERWFSNLEHRGNTGSASLFLLLRDLQRERKLEPGQTVLCFVPESGRFTVSFAQFTVVAGSAGQGTIAPPHEVQGDPRLASLLAGLAEVWHDYQSRLRRTPLVRKIARGSFTREDYLAWMRVWIPQVRVGSQWMTRAADHVQAPFADLVPLIREHAGDEREDYQILFADYRDAGGELALDQLTRSAGGDALSAFMFARAERSNPIDLLGAIYIIEGTGQRVIPQLLPALRRQLGLPAERTRFLGYHGENDQAHLSRWLRAVELVLAYDEQGRHAAQILATARATAMLYLLQFEQIEVS
ncbi:MAG TPA: iron-containing redox enzyme family protein [Polyangiales bacterium]|nr:iron-containing redox enzyme family protein [Polyangiales bacterium]